MELFRNLAKGLKFKDSWDKSRQMANADEEFTLNLHQPAGAQNVYDAMGIGGISESTDVLAADYVDTSMKTKSTKKREATATVSPGKVLENDLAKATGKADEKFDYIEELRKLAKKHGQEFKQDQTSGGTFSLERNGVPEITIDKKYGMEYFGKNPEGQMFQDYIKLSARKYLENNRMIDVWVNEKAIPDFAQREAYFTNVTKNLVEMGIDPERIRFKNAGFDHILDSVKKQKADEKFAPSHSLSDSGEVLKVDRTPEQRDKDIQIQGAFGMLATSYLTSNKQKTAKGLETLLNNVGVSLEFDKKGENLTFKKTVAEPNGEYHSVTFKASDIPNADRVFEIYSKPAVVKNTNNANTEDKITEKTDEKIKAKPTNTAKSETDKKVENTTDTTNQPASKKPDSIVMTNNITALINKSAGDVLKLKETCKKAGFEISFTDSNKTLKVNMAGDTKNILSISLNNPTGAVLTKNQNQIEVFEKNDAKADVNKENKKTSTIKNKVS